MSNDNSQRDEVTPLNEIAAIEKRALEFSYDLQTGLKKSTDAMSFKNQRKGSKQRVKTNLSTRSGASANILKKKKAKNIDLKVLESSVEIDNSKD